MGRPGLEVRRRLRIVALVASLASVWWVIPPSGYAANETELPQELLDALHQNAEALSPVTVVWEQQLGSRLPLQEWLAMVDYSPSDLDQFKPKAVTYCWQDGMSYMHLLESKADIGPFIDRATGEIKRDAKFDEVQFILEESEAACNLEDVFFGHGQQHRIRRGDFSSLNIDPLDGPKTRPPSARLFRPDYFREVGFVLPDTIGKQGMRAKSLLLDLVDQGAEVANVEETSLKGRKCLSVELKGEVKLLGAEGTTRFYLDPSMAYAVFRREERTPSGDLAAHADMNDFVMLSDPDLWLPKRCKVTYHTWHTIPGKLSRDPLHHERFLAKGLERAAIHLERFALHYTVAGTIVDDATLPEAKNMPKGFVRYMVPPDPADLEAAIQSAIDGKPFVPKALQHKRPIRMLLVAFNLVGLTGVLLLWLWRRKCARDPSEQK